jgi:putative FmdB family regulatory protein
MPVYEYICGKCGKKFVEVLRISELNKKKLRCPKCGSTELRKCIEPFFAVTAKKT